MRSLPISRPTIYILLVAIVAAAWFWTSEGTNRQARSARRSVKEAPLNLPDGFDKSDLEARFEPFSDPVRDAFKPVVERRRGGAETAMAPNAVPSILTGGDPNWIYTGMAEIDGIPTGLLENKATGEAEFVNQAASWKDATVSAISPFSLVLVGTNGKSYTMMIGVESTTAPILAQGGFTPVAPNLRGNIGNSIEVVPERPNRRNNQGVATSAPTGNGTNDAQSN